MWTKKDMPDQTGKTVLVTGANSGIGYEIALAFYQKGAHVILACRDNQKAKDAMAKMIKGSHSGTLESLTLDLSDLDKVRAFGEHINRSFISLDLLINNAGIANPPASRTMQGFELQIGINFLGHFALTSELYTLLKSTPDSRIVTVSSNGYQNATIDFDNMKSEKGYDPMREYRQSKLANLVFALELSRRITLKKDHVMSIAAQPGAVETNLTRYISEEDLKAGKERIGAFMEPWQGALSILYASVSGKACSGNMYEPDDQGFRGYPALASLKANALDEKLGKKLWLFAEEATGMSFLS